MTKESTLNQTESVPDHGPLFEGCVLGSFKARHNRFIVFCTIDGKDITAYMPNPGRLIELLRPGVELYLQPTKPEAKLDYMVVAVKMETEAIMLHTHRANDLAEKLINEGRIKDLRGWAVKAREVKHGKSRFDLLLHNEAGEEAFCEVKCCTLFSEKLAMFPDAPSIRAAKHVKHLAEVSIETGKKPFVLFLVQSHRPQAFLPEYHTDLAFAESLLECRKHLNVVVAAMSLDLNLCLQETVECLPILWDVAEKEAKDSGCYLFITEIKEACSLVIGGLGEILFEAGYYVYVGSAKTALSKRLERHKRKRKKLHWHLDYLKQKANNVSALAISTQDEIECDLAQALSGIADKKIEGFGCSDCNCDSHLFYFKSHPFHNLEFMRKLQYFRMDRLLPNK